MSESYSQRRLATMLIEFPSKHISRSPSKRKSSLVDRLSVLRRAPPLSFAPRLSLFSCTKPLLGSKLLRSKLRLASGINAEPCYGQCPPGTKPRCQLLRKLSRSSSAERTVRHKRPASISRSSVWLAVAGCRVAKVRPQTSVAGSRTTLRPSSSIGV